MYAKNAVVKQLGTSFLLCVQHAPHNVCVLLNKIVKLSVYYYAKITPAYAGIT